MRRCDPIRNQSQVPNRALVGKSQSCMVVGACVRAVVGQNEEERFAAEVEALMQDGWSRRSNSHTRQLRNTVLASYAIMNRS